LTENNEVRKTFVGTVSNHMGQRIPFQWLNIQKPFTVF
jgi:hypothetical protein